MIELLPVISALGGLSVRARDCSAANACSKLAANKKAGGWSSSGPLSICAR